MAEVQTANILIADGNEASREALTEIMRQRGCAVVCAAQAAEATARLKARPYDVALLDLDLADGHARDWLRRVRRARPGCRVVATASAIDPSKVACAIRERAYSFFSKPWLPRAVADMAELALAAAHWEDDIELISASPRWIALSVRCKMECADRVVQFVREIHADLAPEQRDDIAAALRELLLNAIEHGGGSDPQKRIRVSSVRTSRSAVFHVQDPGAGFSFDAISHAAVGNPPDEPVRHVGIRAENGVRPGGFGILLTRKLADELIYNEKGNEVLLIKYLKAETER